MGALAYLSKEGVYEGVLICTNKRLIIYTPKMFGRWDVESMPLEHVSYILFKKGLLLGSFVIRTSGGEKIIDNIKKKEGIKMQEIISNQITIVKASISGATIPEPDPMMELQLMFVHGEIAEDEYLRRMMIL